MLFDDGAGRFGLFAGFVLTVTDLAVFNIFVGDDHGIAYPFAVDLQYRNRLADEVFCSHLIGRPHFAGNAIPHGIFQRQEAGQEV